MDWTSARYFVDSLGLSCITRLRQSLDSGSFVSGGFGGLAFLSCFFLSIFTTVFYCLLVNSRVRDLNLFSFLVA